MRFIVMFVTAVCVLFNIDITFNINNDNNNNSTHSQEGSVAK